MIPYRLNSRPAHPIFGAIVAVVLLAAATSCQRPAEPDARMIAEWVHAWYGTIRVERLSPPVASRVMGYATTALYAGMASVRPTLRSLDGMLNGLSSLPRPTNPEAFDATIVAVAAERVVLDSLLQEALPTTQASLARLADSLVRARATAGISPEVQHRSDSLGREIGAIIVAWSQKDGFAETRNRPYTPPVGEGLWRNDAPANTYATQSLSAASEFVALDNPSNQQRAGNTSDRGIILSRPKTVGAKTLPLANMAGATEPYWSTLRPFVLSSWNACALETPPAYENDSSSALYTNARAVVKARNELTPEQRTIAYYWADNGGETGTPVGHWLNIASQMISERKLTSDAAVQLVFATAIGQADAFISAFGYKYTVNLLRPRTYIRRLMDSTWEPLIPTPPFPEYPSAHSTQSASAAHVLTALVGAAPFQDSTSIAIGHAVRRFSSFVAASEEAGMSRVYGGIHYPAGNTSGLSLGRCIGARVVSAIRGDSAAATK